NCLRTGVLSMVTISMAVTSGNRGSRGTACTGDFLPDIAALNIVVAQRQKSQRAVPYRGEVVARLPKIPANLRRVPAEPHQAVSRNHGIRPAGGAGDEPGAFRGSRCGMHRRISGTAAIALTVGDTLGGKIHRAADGALD